MSGTARPTIYVESQYLTCASFFRVLARALKRNLELEAIIVCPFAYRGRVERTVMTSGRARVARILRRNGVAARALIAAPRISHDGPVADPHLPSKGVD